MRMVSSLELLSSHPFAPNSKHVALGVKWCFQKYPKHIMAKENLN